MVIVSFFIAHWLLSVFCQTFFLHRYGAHKMFTMSLGWERFFHLLTYISQGASYLNPRGYAILHRLHHAYSDTPKDPHSPVHDTNLITMMWKTKLKYEALTRRKEQPEKQYDGDVPEWPLLDKIGMNRFSSAMWILIYFGIYYSFATAWWQWLLFPLTCLMGPVHGAIVNWCGHKYGYRNFDVDDNSKNTLVFDFLTLGELFQNNHHRLGTRPNFAARWFEVDPTYMAIRVLAFLRIIKLKEQPVRKNASANIPVFVSPSLARPPEV
jgi:stearoyl-CoA desaturase (delta-9 desaturase)